MINKTPEALILDRAKIFCNSAPSTFKPFNSDQEITYQEEALNYFNMQSLDEINLNEQIGYVFKCMACGLYAFRNRNRPYKEVILDIILKGGDADTNASVAGSILGAYQGYSNYLQNG